MKDPKKLTDLKKKILTLEERIERLEKADAVSTQTTPKIRFPKLPELPHWRR